MRLHEEPQPAGQTGSLMGSGAQEYPRQLTARERELIEWILPVDRKAYRHYRDAVSSMEVVGEGRRGKGEIVLGQPGTGPDFSSPLGAVFAYGVMETSSGVLSVTLREMTDGQLSVEMVGQQSEDVPEEFEEIRRWTYSTWKPADPCPQCRQPVRQVEMSGGEAGTQHLTLALCRVDRRIWVFDELSQVVRLIPVTNYYNELMLHLNIREPDVALNSRNLFTNLPRYSNADLTLAFQSYNALRNKVRTEGPVRSLPGENPSGWKRLTKLFGKERGEDNVGN